VARYIGTLTSDARGKVGGVVMTRARNGTNLKAHGVGVNPRSTYQLSLRQMFASARAAFIGLLGSQQEAWGVLAPQYTYVNALGQSYSPTALQLWTQAYMNAALSGTTPPGLPPTSPPFIDQIVQLTMVRAGSNLTLGAQSVGGIDYTGSWTASCSSQLPVTVNFTHQVRRRPMGFAALGPSIFCGPAFIRAYGYLPGVDTPVSVRAVCFDPVSFISATPLTQVVFVT
jgi:hypothetical protein